MLFSSNDFALKSFYFSFGDNLEKVFAFQLKRFYFKTLLFFLMKKIWSKVLLFRSKGFALKSFYFFPFGANLEKDLAFQLKRFCFKQLLIFLLKKIQVQLRGLLNPKTTHARLKIPEILKIGSAFFH